MFLFLFLLFKNFCLLFIFGCAGSLLLQARFLLLWWVGVTLHFSAGASHCSGFSCRTQVLGAQASVVAARRLRSCGSWAPEWGVFISCCAPAQLLHGMWNLPGPGIKPVSPALASRFLATALPGKSPSYLTVMSGSIPKLTTKRFSSAAGGAKEAGTRALTCLHTALLSSRQSPPPGAPLTLIWSQSFSFSLQTQPHFFCQTSSKSQHMGSLCSPITLWSQPLWLWIHDSSCQPAGTLWCQGSSYHLWSPEI